MCIRDSSWIYNTSCRFRVSQIDSNIFRLVVKIDKSSIKVGDTVSVYRRNDSQPDFGGESATVTSINTANNTITLDNISLFTALDGVEYDVKRIINKVSSNGVQIDVGNNQYTSDITNLYVNGDISEAYVASNSLPNNITSKNIVSYSIPNASEQYFDDYDALTDTYSTIVFATNPEKFEDGDKIIYKSESPIGGLNNNGIYFIRKIAINKIRLYASPIISEVYDSSFLKLKTNSEESDHRFIIFRHSNEILSSNPILRKFPLEQNLNLNENSLNDQEEIGILVDGVEISSPKSRDKVYYGPLESIKVLNGGDGFDVINPPTLEITSATTDAVLEPVIEGSVKEILVDPQQFEVTDVFSLTIDGGNGSGAVLEPIFTEVVNEYRFDTRLTVSYTHLTLPTIYSV